MLIHGKCKFLFEQPWNTWLKSTYKLPYLCEDYVVIVEFKLKRVLNIHAKIARKTRNKELPQVSQAISFYTSGLRVCR